MPLALNNTNINTNTNTNTNIIIDEKKFREETIKNTKFNESVMNINTNIIQSIHPANNININNDNEDDTANILLEVEDLTPESESSNDLKEFDISSTLENNLEAITLKQSNQVYYDIYKKAREKAKQAKKDAIMAYLEVKNIKKTYMIEDMDNSDEDSEAELDDLDSNISVDEAGKTYN